MAKKGNIHQSISTDIYQQFFARPSESTSNVYCNLDTLEFDAALKFNLILLF